MAISEAQLRANRENAKKAGRPKSTATLETQTFREALAKRINGEMESWVEPIEDLAKGHFVEIEGKDGTTKVYKKAPDSAAWQRAMDRAFGKAAQSVDVTSDGKELQGVVVLPSRED